MLCWEYPVFQKDNALLLWKKLKFYSSENVMEESSFSIEQALNLERWKLSKQLCNALTTETAHNDHSNNLHGADIAPSLQPCPAEASQRHSDRWHRIQRNSWGPFHSANLRPLCPEAQKLVRKCVCNRNSTGIRDCGSRIASFLDGSGEELSAELKDTSTH